jgi:AAA domain/Recombinase
MRRDELEMVRLFARRQGRGRTVSDATLEAAIVAAEKIKGFPFSVEQRKAVRAITQGKSADKFVQGVAGAGKSTLALAVRLAYEMEGRKVYGVAFSAKAAAGLGDGTGIGASTIDSFLWSIERKAPPPGSVVSPFGYAAIEAERRGEKVKKKLAINEAEAAIVRRIYDLYRGIEGLQYGVKAIVTKLNAERVTFRGKPFMISNVHRILTSETYTGRHQFNAADSKSKTIRPQAEWIRASPVTQ